MDKKYKLVLIIALIIAGTVVGIFLVFKLAVYLAPFIIAFALTSFIEPLNIFIMKKTKFSRKVSAVAALLLVILVFGSLLVFILNRIYREAESLYQNLPEYVFEIYTNIRRVVNNLSDMYLGLPKEVTSYVDNLLANLSSSLPKIFMPFVERVLNTAVSLPQAVIFVIVTILATYLLSSDRDRIYKYIRSNLPESLHERILSIKNDMFMAFFGYIKAQLIIMTITFFELIVGFYFIGMKHFILLASLIAVLDAFPLIGTGSILIPWAVYEFLNSDFRTGVSLLILYIVVFVVRHMTEPKILGQQIGLHPLLTLISMYVGLNIFGFVGLIIGPLIVLVLKNILSGILKKRNLKEFISGYIKNV